jgi:hypothetical protein
MNITTLVAILGLAAAATVCGAAEQTQPLDLANPASHTQAPPLPQPDTKARPDSADSQSGKEEGRKTTDMAEFCRRNPC